MESVTSGKIAFQEYTNELFLRGIKILTILDTSFILHATDDMLFDKTSFNVKVGENIRLTLVNTGKPSRPGSMGHNVVILGPDASSVIAHTRFVAGGQSDQITFTLSKPGTYDFICTYPGHWGTMQGKIVAE